MDEAPHRPDRKDQQDVLDDVRQMLVDLKTEVSQLRHEMREFEHRTHRSIEYAAEREAANDSAQLVTEHMAKAAAFRNKRETLEHGLSLAPPDGLALEFGVYLGETLRVISEARSGRDVFGFDSFEGLPETWRTGWPVGTFKIDHIPNIPGAELVVGSFHDTLPDFLAEHSSSIAFLHLDCDLYSSAKTVLANVGPRLRRGTVVVFDEYFNYPSWREHEYRAWQEYVADSGIRFTYEAYTVDHKQVVVRITG